MARPDHEIEARDRFDAVVILHDAQRELEALDLDFRVLPGLERDHGAPRLLRKADRSTERGIEIVRIHRKSFEMSRPISDRPSSLCLPLRRGMLLYPVGCFGRKGSTGGSA